MNIKNDIHSSNEVLDNTQQISKCNASNYFKLKYKEDSVKSNSEKHAVVWTTKHISTLLKIYEDKLEMLKMPKKKTRMWMVISKCLSRYNIEVTPDQVRWKINALTNRYKRWLNCGQHDKFRYFKEMHKIYGQLNDDAHDTTRRAQKKQSCYNAKLIPKLNHKTSSKNCQETKAIIDLRKRRSANRSQSKLHEENQCLEHLKIREEQKPTKVENHEKNVKVREEEPEVQEKTFKISESFDYRKMQMWERKHETLLRIEIEKFEMLKKMSSLQK